MNFSIYKVHPSKSWVSSSETGDSAVDALGRLLKSTHGDLLKQGDRVFVVPHDRPGLDTNYGLFVIDEPRRPALVGTEVSA